MNLYVVYVMKEFHGLFSAFSFLKEHKSQMDLGPNHFFIKFLKSTKFLTDLSF